MNDRVYVANRSNVVTGYTGLVADAKGFVTGVPDRTIGDHGISSNSPVTKQEMAVRRPWHCRPDVTC